VIDLAILVLILAYAAFGYWTGVIRRVVGFVAVYVGYLAATNAAPTAANVILQAFGGWALPDAITAGYFLVLLIVIVVIEVMAALVHNRLQLAAILFDRQTGALVGAITAVLGVTVALYLLNGSTLPPAGSPDGNQITIQDTIRKATLAPALYRGPIGRPTILIFYPVIPTDPNTYFNGQGPRAQ
jgi:uncharacterized membrane protein required for colicin V production